MGKAKTEQLQIRVTRQEKAEIRRAAKAAGMDISSWVLGQLLAQKRGEFRALMNNLGELGSSTLAFAALNDFVTQLPRAEFARAVDVTPPKALSSASLNYLAAMVEQAATKKNVSPPRWTTEVEPLREPYFGTKLKSLRLLLMTTAPIPFRRRNIFIDSSIGDRI